MMGTHTSRIRSETRWASLFAGAAAAVGIACGPAMAQDCLWSALGEGVDRQVLELAVYDPGNGPRLFASGFFDRLGSGAEAARIAQWDGSAWSPVGSGLVGDIPDARGMLAFDDGTGEKLYVAGRFSSAGGVPANSFARWDGRRWEAVGSGMALGFGDTMAIFDDGRGPALYVGGNFRSMDGIEANSVARWDGRSWESLGSGLSTTQPAAATATSMAVYDDGRGPALYVAGAFEAAGGVPASNIARWDGRGWEAVDGGVDDTIWTLATYDDGTGPKLYAGGAFLRAGRATASRIAQWDGRAWSAMGAGLDGTALSPVPRSMLAFDDGTGPKLFVAGGFDTAGGIRVDGMATWDGSTWRGLGARLNASGSALAIYDDGTGPAVVVGGAFTTAGGFAASRLARVRCVACRADFDGDGALTVLDFLSFFNAFETGDLRADFDGDGRLTVEDFLAFQDAFAAGCP